MRRGIYHQVETAVITLNQLRFGIHAGGRAYGDFIILDDAVTLENFTRSNTLPV
jgi:hypothetical protein